MNAEATPDPLRVALRLSELVSARLCHDLSGLLGTLMGTLELATEDPDNAEQALNLANDAAASLGRRLRLLRAAWAESGDALSVVSLQRLAEGLSHAGRIRLEVTGLEPESEFAPAAARVLLNVLLVAVEALPVGRGVIALSGSARQDVVVTVEGPRAAWPAGLAATLAAPQQLWTLLGGNGNGGTLAPTRNLQIALAVMTARAAGFGLSFLMASVPSESAAPLLLTFSRG
jgi:hypothetical protein